MTAAYRIFWEHYSCAHAQYNNLSCFILSILTIKHFSVACQLSSAENILMYFTISTIANKNRPSNSIWQTSIITYTSPHLHFVKHFMYFCTRYMQLSLSLMIACAKFWECTYTDYIKTRSLYLYLSLSLSRTMHMSTYGSVWFRPLYTWHHLTFSLPLLHTLLLHCVVW